VVKNGPANTSGVGIEIEALVLVCSAAGDLRAALMTFTPRHTPYEEGRRTHMDIHAASHTLRRRPQNRYGHSRRVTLPTKKATEPVCPFTPRHTPYEEGRRTDMGIHAASHSLQQPSS
jgi:hypothetical protein